MSVVLSSTTLLHQVVDACVIYLLCIAQVTVKLVYNTSFGLSHKNKLQFISYPDLSSSKPKLSSTRDLGKRLRSGLLLQLYVSFFAPSSLLLITKTIATAKVEIVRSSQRRTGKLLCPLQVHHKWTESRVRGRKIIDLARKTAAIN